MNSLFEQLLTSNLNLLSIKENTEIKPLINPKFSSRTRTIQTVWTNTPALFLINHEILYALIENGNSTKKEDILKFPVVLGWMRHFRISKWQIYWTDDYIKVNIYYLNYCRRKYLKSDLTLFRKPVKDSKKKHGCWMFCIKCQHKELCSLYITRNVWSCPSLAFRNN